MNVRPGAVSRAGVSHDAGDVPGRDQCVPVRPKGWWALSLANMIGRFRYRVRCSRLAARSRPSFSCLARAVRRRAGTGPTRGRSRRFVTGMSCSSAGGRRLRRRFPPICAIYRRFRSAPPYTAGHPRWVACRRARPVASMLLRNMRAPHGVERPTVHTRRCTSWQRCSSWA